MEPDTAQDDAEQSEDDVDEPLGEHCYIEMSAEEENELFEEMCDMLDREQWASTEM